jgi:hypothetical protein
MLSESVYAVRKTVGIPPLLPQRACHFYAVHRTLQPYVCEQEIRVFPVGFFNWQLTTARDGGPPHTRTVSGRAGDDGR